LTYLIISLRESFSSPVGKERIKGFRFDIRAKQKRNGSYLSVHLSLCAAGKPWKGFKGESFKSEENEGEGKDKGADQVALICSQ